MKKLMGISVIAALAVLPMAANAELTARTVTAGDAATGGSTSALATTSYVQGAYNAANSQINALISDTAVAEKAGGYEAIESGATVGANLVALDEAIAGLQGDGQNSVDNKIKTQAQTADFTPASGMTANTIGAAINELDGEVDALQTQMGDTSLSNVSGLTADNVTDAIVELQGDKQEKSDSTVAEAAQGTYTAITAGNGVGANLVQLDSHVKALETSLGNTSAQSIADTYATKVGTLATINASTVPIVTGWGQDATTTTTLNVSAPNAYQAGTTPANPTVDCTDPANAQNPACNLNNG